MDDETCRVRKAACENKPKKPIKKTEPRSAKKGENQEGTGSLMARKEFVKSRKLLTVSTTTKKQQKMRQSH